MDIHDKSKSGGSRLSRSEMDEIVKKARMGQNEKMKGYREQSLSIHPWVCARCGREFSSKNLHMLTVHHRDHNHDNNPPDGSNWENLCVYCHDNEHRRYLDHLDGAGAGPEEKEAGSISHKPFAALANLLKDK